MKCKRCGCEKITKNGKKDKKQNYLCKNCGHQFISEFGRHTEQEENLAVLLYCMGLSFTAIARILHYHTSTVMRWIKKYAAPEPKGEMVVELDELWDFVRSRKINIGFDNHTVK